MFFESLAFGFLAPVMFFKFADVLYSGGKKIAESYSKPKIQIVCEDSFEPEGIAEIENKWLEDRAETSQKTTKTSKPKNLVDIAYKKPEFQRLNKHDELIIKWTDYYNARMNPPVKLEYKAAKAMMCTESANFPDAFAHDPMQMANKGDMGLDLLRSRGDNLDILDTDFSEFAGIEHTPNVNGKWDYTNSRMTPELSIKGGLAFLFSKAITPAYRDAEKGEVLEYSIVRGDNPSVIGKKLGTTSRVIIKYNPGLNPNNLQIGQKIRYRKAKLEKYAADWKDWRSAVMSYNGGGSRNHGKNFDFWMSQFDK